LPIVASPAFSARHLGKLVQGVDHWFAGNPDQTAKELVQLQDQENGAYDVSFCLEMGFLILSKSAMSVN
jgi:hypothetical protein